LKNSLVVWWQTFEQRPQQCWLISLAWLLLLSWVAFLWNIGVLGVMDKTEALFVEVAHQMYLTNDWITPHWNGQTFFDYPVWGYWLVALSFKLFGVSEWAARLPVALCAIAVVWLSFYTLRFWGFFLGEKTESTRLLWIRAWLGAGILALNPGWVGWGRTSVTDMFLASAISLTMLSFYLGYVNSEQPKVQKIWYGLTPVFAAIAVLAKGPVGLLLPSLAIAAFLGYVGQWQAVWREVKGLLLAMIVIFCGIAVPWYALATQANGLTFLNSFLGFSNFQRFTSVLYRHAGPWYFYLPWCFILLLPWSTFLPLTLARLQFWRRKVWQHSPRDRQLGLFCFFWFVLILLFFSSAATKLAGYILPIVPAGAIMITLFWSEEISLAPTKIKYSWAFFASGIFNFILLLVMAIAAFISPQFVGSDPAYPNFAQVLSESGLPIIFSLILSLATLLMGVSLFRKPFRAWLWSANLVGFLGTLIFVIPSLAPIMDSQRQQPFRELSQIAGQTVKPKESIFVMGYPRYSLVYYSQHPATFLDDVPYAIELLQKENDPNPLATVLIVTDPQLFERFKLKPEDYQLIAQKGVYHLIRVPKSVLIRRSQ